MQKEKLIIIGAGAAGLMAAAELAGHFDVTVLEALPRTGGRIWTQDGHEWGAEFVHGRLPHTFRLLQEAGIRTVPVAGKMYRKKGNTWAEQDDMTEGWDRLLSAMQSLREDMTLDRFLHVYFGSVDDEELRQQATNFAEGFDLADTHTASTLALYREWSGETEENFRVAGGYAGLLDHLQQLSEKKGCHILTSHPVMQVDWESNEVTVTTRQKDVFTASRLLVTIPASVLGAALKPSSINFTPPIDRPVKAAASIGAGRVIKAGLMFKKAFWQNDAGFFFCDGPFPTWWTQLPGQTPLLTGWAGGRYARDLESLSDEAILSKARQSLASLFDRSLEDITSLVEKAWVVNWTEQYTCGPGYSFATLETDQARKTFEEPVDNIIYFAGEGYYTGDNPGTVEAALASARETSLRILGDAGVGGQ